MSQNSSITVDQPLARNNLRRRRNGNGGGRQMFPLPNPRPLSPPTARRTLVLQNQTDIVSAISAVSQTTRQAMYILSGRGYVSLADLMSLPSRERKLYVGGRGSILYLSGWFQPMITVIGGVAIPASRPNGILHVSVTAGSQSVAIANSLISSGPVEVDVVFLCSPGSMIPSDAPGGPRAPIRLGVYGVPAAQAPAAQAPAAQAPAAI